MTNSGKTSLPHDVRLIAAVSRLIDLHQSRGETEVYVPEAPARAGYLLALALLLLDTLREIEMDRGPSFVPIVDVATVLRRRVASVTAAEVDLVIESLASEREIRFGVEDGNGGIDFGLTKDSTPLLEKARGFGQIQLSENARLLLRVSAMKDSWLYSDIDADKLVKAIERGQFGDVPRFCKLMVLDIASKHKQLTSAMERPTLADIRDLLVENGANIADSLREAADVVKRACALIFDQRTREDFDRWVTRNGISWSIGNVQTEIELVMQHVEALSRRFVGFLETAQRARAVGGVGVQFLKTADSLSSASRVIDVEQLSAILARFMPWAVKPAYFSPTQMVGSVDFDLLTETTESRQTSSFTLDPENQLSHGRLLDFILRNRALIIDRLKTGPATFSELMTTMGFVTEAGETPIDFLGVYSAPEHLDGEQFSIAVGLTGERFDVHIGNERYAGSDPLIVLTERTV
ncbi:hypothetical protein [Paraburkholderia adhaesiva]|uniref:hypothetical protein n=1 Tax=Paraburkholderia adhaesiva TaxID=2883244 RepID=UPI001F418F54|nr:hypothetical protein [Paraburkholderia adhaesiva]